jgi:TPR repeat protein
MLYSGIGVAKNVEKAVDIHIKNCENGNFESCSQAGFMLQKNSGDNVQIKDLYSKSCINNSGAGCNNLGFFYFSIEKNSEKATELYERSCNLGFGMGCLNSGLSYFHNGNEDLALTRFEKACDMGVDDACFVLSTLQISDY